MLDLKSAISKPQRISSQYKVAFSSADAEWLFPIC
jgi:hypothetical protein